MIFAITLGMIVWAVVLARRPKAPQALWAMPVLLGGVWALSSYFFWTGTRDAFVAMHKIPPGMGEKSAAFENGMIGVFWGVVPEVLWLGVALLILCFFTWRLGTTSRKS
jgi:hypothetical protein